MLAHITGPLRHARSGIIATLLIACTHAVSAQQQPVLVHMDHFTPHQVRVDVFSIVTPQNVLIEATGADERFPRHGKLAVLDRVLGAGSDNNGDDAWRGNAWIIDAATRRVVWELRTSRTAHESNGMRTFKGTVLLQPGTYETYYASYSSFSSTLNVNSSDHLTRAQMVARTKYDDDGVSRDFQLTVRGFGQAQPSNAYVKDIEGLQRNALISLTGLRPGETRKAAFVLDKPARVDVYALGEVRVDESFDYGWIINADTHQKVWALDFNSSQPAGGASKNREMRTTVTLPAGRYAAMYTMDDSHDTGDWNTAPPHDPGMWGMTLRLADAADRAHAKVVKYDAAPANAIVAINGVGNSEQKTQGFTLKKPMDVRVYALGEGSSNHMSDYGWITDASSHRRIWSMEYPLTAYAGGGTKNRMIAQVVHLPAGSYIAGYKTDDSHSPEDWNTAAPIDGDMWGITIWPVNAAEKSNAVAYDPSSDEGTVLAKLINMSDDEDARATFKLTRPTQVRVYAVGEGRDNQMFDRGLIEERGTKRVVWEMSYRGTAPAGGAQKNRMFNGTITLPAGDYVLRWVSDDSHSYDSWNEDPPEDPAHWGITLYLAGGTSGK